MGSWEHTPHGADIGVRGRGETLDSAFEQAALALMALITEPAKIASTKSISIACSAPDRELLLLEWLNALIFEMAVRNMLFGRFRVHLEGESLEATAWGEPVDVARHEPAVEPKGATFTGLRVFREPGGDWCAECIVDV